MASWYNLEVGDRVCFWMKKNYTNRIDLSDYPWGTISEVTDACFFPYLVKWDNPHECGEYGLGEGAYQPSCFNWDEMERVGHTRHNLGRRDGQGGTDA